MMRDLPLFTVFVGVLRFFMRNNRHRHMFPFGSFLVLDGVSWIFSGSSPFSVIDPALIQQKDDAQKMKASYEGHRERLRNRYVQAGGNGFPDYDMIELLLTYAVQRRDVKPMARELLRHFGDFAGVFNADLKSLCEIKGLGERSALLIVLIRDLCSRYLETKILNTDVISSTNDLRNYVRMHLSGFTEEVFMMISLDVKNHVIKFEILTKGTIDSAVVYPRVIAETALKNKAASVIIVHNHPSGATNPSSADRKFTTQVRDALKTLDIRLLDHLIVSRTHTFSFLDHNLLEFYP